MIYFAQQITEFTSTNAVDTVLEYNPLTPYNTADFARVGSWNYKSIIDANLGNEPLENLGILWYDGKYPSNSYAMIDLLEDTKTEWVADGIVEFTRGGLDSIAIGNFKASEVKIEYLDAVNAVLDTDIYTFSVNRDVYDFWSYLYGGFTDTVTETIYTTLKRIGVTVRVTFSYDGGDTYCGYFIAGISTDMGKTLDKVSFPYKKIGRIVTSESTFETIVSRNELIRKQREAKLLTDEVLLFVIDPSENSYHENMIILGKITKVDGVGENSTLNKMSWTIEKNIQE